jgi:lysophospholipase L1-like esterase
MARAAEITGTAQARVLTGRETLAACEQRLARRPGHAPGRLPTMAIVGASYTAGVGPHDPELSWAVQLARMLGWNAVIEGVSGAGYVSAGAGGQGPVAQMLARERLAALDPALVIVQAGHNDAGVPPWIERQRVREAIAFIRAAAPRARIALLTVFTTQSPADSAALYQADDAIVAAGIAADPDAIIMDPLAEHWTFEHFDGGLHPTAAGDAWIARKAAAILRAHGVLPAATAPAAGTAATAGTTPTICVEAVGGHVAVGRPRGGGAALTAGLSARIRDS